MDRLIDRLTDFYLLPGPAGGRGRPHLSRARSVAPGPDGDAGGAGELLPPGAEGFISLYGTLPCPFGGPELNVSEIHAGPLTHFLLPPGPGGHQGVRSNWDPPLNT